MGAITNQDVVSWMSAEIHELEHGTAGYDYNGYYDGARTGDFAHVPGSCTVDHSLLQVRCRSS